MSEAAGEDRIVTVPNAITAVRLALLPVFVWLLFAHDATVAAGIVLAVLGATDWVDGSIARRFNQVSTVGKVIDPVADRLLIGTAVLATVIYGAVPVWFAVLTLAREVLISAAVLSLAALGAARIDVAYIGKMGTFLLMTSYPGFLFGYGTSPINQFWLGAAYAVGIAGLILSWSALFAYIEPARGALRRGRSAQHS